MRLLLPFVFLAIFALPCWGTSAMERYLSGQGSCPAPFFAVGHQCFYVNKAKKNWYNAREACLRIGADLVEPFNTFLLLEALRDKFGEREDGYYWVGGEIFSKQGDPTQWAWFSGRSVTAWQGGNPNKRPAEHCLMIGIAKNDDPPMYDFFCDKEYESICGI